MTLTKGESLLPPYTKLFYVEMSLRRDVRILLLSYDLILIIILGNILPNLQDRLWYLGIMVVVLFLFVFQFPGGGVSHNVLSDSVY